MKIIDISKTEKTPEIILDDTQKIFQIKGNCLPENIQELSQLVTEKLGNYLDDYIIKNNKDKDKNKYKESKPFKINFKLGYFNTAAAKFIADVIMLVNTYIRKGSDIKIYWHYHEDDYDMLEAGEDISMMVNVPLTYVMIAKA